jgi:dTDP-4-dehydrorhamnose 3,5-epimerase
MTFTPTVIPGAWIIDVDRREDERGFFARTFDHTVFAARGLQTTWNQCSVAFTTRRGTIRGLHFQRAPHEEVKLVRCSRGEILDVLVDLRQDSPACRRHVAVLLNEDNRRLVYVPAGVAHGYQSLSDATEVAYQITPDHVPDAAAGVRFDDPAFAITWPLPVTVVSERDRTFPDFAHDNGFAGVSHAR